METGKLQIITLLESKKSTYVAYLVIETIVETEWEKKWLSKQIATHIALASWTSEEWVKKIYKFCKEFWVFQNSDLVWIKSVYIDEYKKNKILNF
jgi:hypothetical protein